MNETSTLDFSLLERQADALFAGETDALANSANLAALIFNELPRLNWVGFYFLRGDELVLGPFQGKPACVRIALGRGVCGKAAAERRSLRIPDVHAFDDHIVCDVDSRSELVVPLVAGERLLGVLDLDSPVTDRFNEADQRGVEALATRWLAASDLASPVFRQGVAP